MDLFSVRNLTHWTACGDLLLIWKHNYSLLAGGNFLFGNSTGAKVSVVFNGAKRVGVYVA